MRICYTAMAEIESWSWRNILSQDKLTNAKRFINRSVLDNRVSLFRVHFTVSYSQIYCGHRSGQAFHRRTEHLPRRYLSAPYRVWLIRFALVAESIQRRWGITTTKSATYIRVLCVRQQLSFTSQFIVISSSSIDTLYWGLFRILRFCKILYLYTLVRNNWTFIFINNLTM